MPYKCIHCSKIYDDGSRQILSGCEKCSGKFFFYLRQEQLDRMRQNGEIVAEFTEKEKKQIEEDVREISGIENEEVPVFLDFESIKIIKPGKYVVDLGNLFSMKKPRVYKLEDGKYIIDLSTVIKEKERKQTL